MVNSGFRGNPVFFSEGNNVFSLLTTLLGLSLSGYSIYEYKASKKKSDEAMRMFNGEMYESHAKKQSTSINIVTTPNGIGLAYNF